MEEWWGGSDLLRKPSQCDKNCLHLDIFILGVGERDLPPPPPLLCTGTPNSWGRIQPPNCPPTPLSPGFLWQLGPLILSAEPAAATHRGPLHPPHPAGLARAHRHPHGTPRVPGQVRLSTSLPHAVSWGRCVGVQLCSHPISPLTLAVV